MYHIQVCAQSYVQDSRFTWVVAYDVIKNMCSQESDAVINHLAIVPTILDWFDIKYPSYTLNKQPVQLTGGLCCVYIHV